MISDLRGLVTEVERRGGPIRLEGGTISVHDPVRNHAATIPTTRLEDPEQRLAIARALEHDLEERGIRLSVLEPHDKRRGAVVLITWRTSSGHEAETYGRDRLFAAVHTWLAATDVQKERAN